MKRQPPLGRDGNVLQPTYGAQAHAETRLGTKKSPGGARSAPGCPEHNPIEHRLFARITRVCQGMVFHTVAIAKRFRARARTAKGLTATVDILTGVYQTATTCVRRISSTGCRSSSTSTSRAGTITPF